MTAPNGKDSRRMMALAMLDLYVLLKKQLDNSYLYDEERERTYRRFMILQAEILQLMGAD